MSEFAVMPLNDYVDTCDSIREKTHRTDDIKSSELPNKIDAVFNAGKLAVLKDSKYMNANEIGAIVSVNDVSPIEHNVGVKLTSKNLYAPTLRDFKHNGITAVKNNNNTYTINGTASEIIYIHVGEVLSCEKGKTYYFSGGTANIFLAYQLRNNGSGVDTIRVEDRVQSGNATNWNEVNVVIVIPKGTVADNVIIKPMISLFDNTPYTPYIADFSGVNVTRCGKNLFDKNQTVTANADGTVEGLTSLSPNMTLYTDNDGAIVNCQYYRDIDTYIDNLLINFAMTGGV